MNAVILPILGPLFTAVLALAWWRPSRARRWAMAGAMVGQLAVSAWIAWAAEARGVLTLGVGNWSPPFGITLAIDLLAALLMVTSTLVVAVSVVYGFAELPPRFEHPLRLPLVQLLLMGVNLSFATGDLFNLFVAFEVLLISSYSLLTLEADDWDVKQAFPYLAINLVGSTLFLCAAGLCYACFGTLNYADLAQRAASMPGDPRVLVIGLLLLLVFATKSGLAPLFYWLPHSYPTLATPLAAIYGGLLTKVGVFVAMRLLGTVFPQVLEAFQTPFAWLAVLTAIIGGLGAISRTYIRGILSFHIVSQVGLMLLAVSFGGAAAYTAAFVILAHNMVVKSSLFLLGGTGACLARTDDLARLGNLARLTPVLAALFLLQALSLAGLPPLSGFWGKYLLLAEGVHRGAYALVAASVVASLLTLFSMLKIWLAVFWTERPETVIHLEDPRWPRLAGIAALLVAAAMGMGPFAEPFLRLGREASTRALDQRAYIDAVMAVRGKDAQPHLP